MAYSTQADLEKELESEQLVQLADDNDDGIADVAVIADVIAKSDGIIDGYLGTRYTVPVTPVPDLVRGFSVAIAIYRLFGRRNQKNDARTRAYDDALKMLAAISRGTATLGVSESTVPTRGGPQGSRTEDDRRLTMGRASDTTASDTLRHF